MNNELDIISAICSNIFKQLPLDKRKHYIEYGYDNEHYVWEIRLMWFHNQNWHYYKRCISPIDLISYKDYIEDDVVRDYSYQYNESVK